MTGSGHGTIWLRINHDLVGKTIAEKQRRRFEQRQRGDGDAVRVHSPVAGR